MQIKPFLNVKNNFKSSLLMSAKSTKILSTITFILNVFWENRIIFVWKGLFLRSKSNFDLTKRVFFKRGHVRMRKYE